MFDSSALARKGLAVVSPTDRAIADTFIGYVTAFVRTGDPEAPGQPSPRRDAASSELMCSR